MKRLQIDGEQYRVLLQAIAMSESIKVEKSSKQNDWRYCCATYYLQHFQGPQKVIKSPAVVLFNIDFDETGSTFLTSQRFINYEELLTWIYLSKRFRTAGDITINMHVDYVRSLNKASDLINSLVDFVEYCGGKRSQFTVYLNNRVYDIAADSLKLDDSVSELLSRGFRCIQVQTNMFSNQADKAFSLSMEFKNEEQVREAINGFGTNH